MTGALDTENFVDITASAAFTSNLFDINTTAASSGNIIDITTATSATSGNLIDLNFGNIADTGDGVNISMGAAAVGAQGLVMSTSAGIRTQSAIQITENNTTGAVPTIQWDSAETRGGLLDANLTGALGTENFIDIDATAAFTSNLVDITTSTVANTGNLIDLNIGNNASTGDAINISLGNTAAASRDGLDITTGTITTSGTLQAFTATLNAISVGTVKGVNLSPSGSFSGGTTTAVDIGSITDAGTTSTAINIGTGWDKGLQIAETASASTTGYIDIDIDASTSSGGTYKGLDFDYEVTGTPSIFTNYTGAIINYTNSQSVTILANQTALSVNFTDAGTTSNSNNYGISSTVNISVNDASGTSPSSTYGFYTDVNNTGSIAADVATYGVYADALGILSAGTTINVYGGRFISAGNSTGSSTTYGLHASSSGADTNYGLYLDTTASASVETGINITENWDTGIAFGVENNGGWLDGTLISNAYTGSNTQTAAITGVNLNFNSGFTGLAGANLTGYTFSTPSLTATSATTYTGFSVPTAGGITSNGGNFSWYGANIKLPAITQTANTALATGVYLDLSGATITTNGTVRGIDISNTASVGAGTLQAINIGNASGASTSKTAINIGSGWDYGICFDCDGTYTPTTVSGGLRWGTDGTATNNIELFRSANGEFTLQDAAGTDFIRASTSTFEINLGAQVGGTAQRLCHNGADAATGVQAIGDCNATQADLAEYYDSVDATEAGDLVSTDNAYQIDTPLGAVSVASVKKSTGAYDNEAIGVVSTNPSGEVLGESSLPYMSNPKPIALAGRVPVKVSTENGDIAPGDPLTSSSTPGVAMKATKSGPIVGKALAGYSNADPAAIGKILVFVHTGWYVAPVAQDGGSQMSDLSGLTSINTQTLTVGTIHATEIFVGDRKLAMGPAGELIIDGSVSILGDVTISGDINLDGVLGATTVKTKTIEIDIPSPDPDTGKSSSTIGDDTITAGQTEKVIETTAVKTDSKIFVTATTTTDKVLSATDITSGESFKVQIPAASTGNIKFNWWIVQVAGVGN